MLQVDSGAGRKIAYRIEAEEIGEVRVHACPWGDERIIVNYGDGVRAHVAVDWETGEVEVEQWLHYDAAAQAILLQHALNFMRGGRPDRPDWVAHYGVRGVAIAAQVASVAIRAGGSL